MEEIWKPIARFEGLVEASSVGRVRTTDRIVPNSRGGGTRVIKGRLLKFRRHPWGYSWCEFTLRGRRNAEFVHRLVAEAFYGPCRDGDYVLRSDNDPKNSAASNLRYGTPTENCADKLIHGTQPTGEQIPWHKLKESQILDIRLRRSLGEKLTSIASDFDVSEVYVHSICTGKKWSGVGGPITGKFRVVNILSSELRLEVLRRRNEGMGIHKLALMFNVSNTQIHNLVRKHEDKKSISA